MRDLTKANKINFMSGLLFLMSAFSSDIKLATAQESNIPSVEQVFDDLDSLQCEINQNVHQSLNGTNFSIGLSGLSGVFNGQVFNIETENIDFNTNNWEPFDLNFEFFSTDINYKMGLAARDLDFYILFSDRTQIYSKFGDQENFNVLLDSNNQSIAQLNLFFSELIYFPLVEEVWIFSSTPNYLIRLEINSNNYQDFSLNGILTPTELFRDTSSASHILDHTIVTQYANGNCGSLSITTEGVMDLGNILPENVSNLCNENTRLIGNERQIGVFYFKNINGNIDQVICNQGLLKPFIQDEIDPIDMDMEIDMEVPVEDMELDMEVPVEDMQLDMDPPVEDMDVDMQVPVEDMQLDMQVPAEDMEVPIEDMDVDMQVPAEDMEVPIEDMDVDMQVPVEDMDVDMQVPVEDMELDMQVPVEDMELDMEVPVEDMQLDMKVDKEDQNSTVDMMEESKSKQKNQKSGCSIETDHNQNSQIMPLIGLLLLLSRKRKRRKKESF